jgi:putative transposase
VRPHRLDGPDGIYLRVGGRWCYLYRAVDRHGNLVDVMPSERRDLKAARAFFRSAKTVTGVVPARVTTDGHDGYPGAIRSELVHVQATCCASDGRGGQR